MGKNGERFMINDYDKFAKEREEAILKGTKKSHRFSEKPMMKKMLPDLSGKKVLLLGCGTGEETMLVETFGATDITGIDLSEVSINLAKERYPKYKFYIGDMHQLSFADKTFDFVYSSLALHYSDSPEIVYKEVYRVLKQNGQFLFSVGHPIRWASETVELNGENTKVIGFTVDYENNGITYGNYLTYAPHEHHFKNGEVLKFYVGPPSMYFKLAKKTGFSITDFEESKCTEEALEANKNYYQRFSELPQFMAFLITKNKR